LILSQRLQHIPILAAFQKKPRNLQKEIHVRKWQTVENKTVFAICPSGRMFALNLARAFQT
jgi:hypothetical protein